MFYITVNNGVKIAVYDLNSSCENIVFMVHGWPLSEKIFEYQKNLLVDKGYRVITIDLRGFGNSDVTTSGYCYDQFASDIYTIVRKLNLYSFTLVGFSMGGAIVSRYMGLFKGYGVKKLCLLAAAIPRYTQCKDFPYGVTKDSVNKLIKEASLDRAKLSEDFSNMLLYSPHSNAIKKWFRDISLSASSIGTIKSAYALRDEDCRKDLGAIDVPTGIFHGKKDLIVPYELSILQKEYIKNSNLFTFEYSGHGIFYDELERFNQCFLEFIAC